MTEPRDGQLLPTELALALRRSTQQTLTALQSLRTALRDHVRDERARGVSMAQIDADLEEMIAAAGGESNADGYPPERIEELIAQVAKWSRAFYSR